MRHGRHVKKLGVKQPHRKAMLSNMANSLITLGKIKTTTARAKAIKGNIDKLITLGKKGDIHARRQAFSILQNKETVKKLFEEIAPEFKNTNGGYTRVAFFGRRLGDGALLSIIELNLEKKMEVEPAKKGKKSESEAEEFSMSDKVKKKTTKKKAAKKKTAKKKTASAV